MSKKQLSLSKMQKLGIKFIVSIFLLSYIFFNFSSNVLAITQVKKEYLESELENYPGFKEKIEILKNAHKNWNFTILYTDIDWNEAIRNETTAAHGRSLVPKGKTGEWLCPVCGDVYDTGKWVCASEIAVAHYMDPRNFLNENNVFMFEDLGFNEKNQTIDGVKKIIEKAPYLDANVIMNAAKKVGISPYHLASRIVQEQGNRQEASSTANGKYPGYEGYYNFLNIGASGNGQTSVIVNALEYAKANGWTSPEISIEKGAEFIANGYIKRGQDTIYLQKFDVDNQDGKMYYHQYMQNIMAPEGESTRVKNTYKDLGAFEPNSEFKLNFIIPVYKNMPKELSRMPKSDGEIIMDDIVTEDVEITGDNVNVRAEKNTDSEIITKLNKGDKVLRIEKANKEVNGYKWDCILLKDGRKGYISSGYVKKIDTITNCNEIVELTGNGVYVRNGPGKDKTTTITSLSKGDRVTRIEKGKYVNIEGYDWDRIILPNGKTGYIASKYLRCIEVNDNGENNDESNDEKNTLKEGKNILCEPRTDVETIKKSYSGAVIKNKDGEEITTGNLATGYTVTIGEEKYTIVKRGDTSGDGEIDARDSLRVLKYSVGTYNLENEFLKSADINKDGIVDARDSLRILKYSVGTFKIEV